MQVNTNEIEQKMSLERISTPEIEENKQKAVKQAWHKTVVSCRFYWQSNF